MYIYTHVCARARKTKHHNIYIIYLDLTKIILIFILYKKFEIFLFSFLKIFSFSKIFFFFKIKGYAPHGF